MNVLITSISIFQRKISQIKYSITVGSELYEFDACQTNESILKALKYILGSQKLDRVIALCSDAVINKRVENCNDFPFIMNKTAWEYYKEIVVENFPECEFSMVRIENDFDQEKPTGEILQSICESVSSGDNVYIDVAGGQRTTINIIQLLTKILRYKGIHNPGSYYSNIQRNEKEVILKGTIENNMEFMRLSDLADAINEFVTTGKAVQFSSCFQTFDNVDVRNLMESMNDFSDKIRLGDVDNLDTIVGRLKIAIAGIKAIKNSSVEYVVLQQLLKVIEDKLIGNSEKIDYPKIVRWCVDNALIQQALAVFVEKIPVYMYEQKYYVYNGDVNDYAQNGQTILSKDYQTNMFFQGIFGILSQSKGNSVEGESLDYSRLLKMTKSFIAENKLKPQKQADLLLKEFSKTSSFSSEEKMANSLRNNDKKICEILGSSFCVEKYKKQLQTFANSLTNTSVSDSEKKLNTLQKKFIFAKKVSEGTAKPSNFKIYITNKELSKMMFAYLYIKAMRNRISHFSSDETLTKEQMDILCQQGFSFEKYNIAVLSKNILHALDMVMLRRE